MPRDLLYNSSKWIALIKFCPILFKIKYEVKLTPLIGCGRAMQMSGLIEHANIQYWLTHA